MNEDIDFEILVDCTNSLKALGDIMAASNPSTELYQGTVVQLGLMILETVGKLEKTLGIGEG